MGRPDDDDLGPACDLDRIGTEPPECELDRILEAPGPEVLEEDEYPDYNNTNTRVISGPIGGTKFPGFRAATWRLARDHAATIGTVVKFWTVPGRWFARIKRTHEA